MNLHFILKLLLIVAFEYGCTHAQALANTKANATNNDGIIGNSGSGLALVKLVKSPTTIAPLSPVLLLKRSEDIQSQNTKVDKNIQAVNTSLAIVPKVPALADNNGDTLAASNATTAVPLKETPNETKDEENGETTPSTMEDEKREVTTEDNREATTDENRDVTTDENREVTSDENRDVTTDENREVTSDEKREVTTEETREVTTEETREVTTDTPQIKGTESEPAKFTADVQDNEDVRVDKLPNQQQQADTPMLMERKLDNEPMAEQQYRANDIVKSTSMYYGPRMEREPRYNGRYANMNMDQRTRIAAMLINKVLKRQKFLRFKELCKRLTGASNGKIAHLNRLTGYERYLRRNIQKLHLAAENAMIPYLLLLGEQIHAKRQVVETPDHKFVNKVDAHALRDSLNKFLINTKILIDAIHLQIQQLPYVLRDQPQSLVGRFLENVRETERNLKEDWENLERAGAGALSISVDEFAPNYEF